MVVLPTPPEPQQTTIDRSSTSSTSAGTPALMAGPEPASAPMASMAAAQGVGDVLDLLRGRWRR